MNNDMFTTGQFTPGEPGSPLYYGGIPTPNQQTAPNINTSSNNMNNTDFIEDVLKAVEPIQITVYATFNGSKEWLDKRFSGILEAAGRDHIIISDPATGHWTLIPNIYVDYIVFDESIKKYIQN